MTRKDYIFLADVAKDMLRRGYITEEGVEVMAAKLDASNANFKKARWLDAALVKSPSRGTA